MLIALLSWSLAHANLCSHHEYARDARALQRLLPQPPCELKKLKQPLEVMLIGENHHSLIAQQIRSVGVRRAERGEVAFLSETSNRGALLPTEVPRDATLVGLESTAGLSVLLAYEIRGPTTPYNEFRAITLLRTYLPKSPLLQDALRAARAEVDDDRAAMAIFDDALNDPTASEPPAGAAPFLNKITRAAFALASTKYAAQLDGSPWPDIPYRNADREILNTRLMALRDREFARAAGRGICGFARQFKRVFINVGDAHVPGVRRQLEADFGSSITIRYFNPFAAGEPEAALGLLRE